MEGRGIGPSSDAEQHFEVAVLLFQVIDSLEVAIEVCAGVIPRIARIMNVLIGPQIGEVDLARVRSYVRKCVENMTI